MLMIYNLQRESLWQQIQVGVLMRCRSSSQQSSRLSFHCNDRPVAWLETKAVFQSSASPSRLACITFDTIRKHRERHIGSHKRASRKSLIEQHRNRGRDSLQVTAKDPYLVAILIALAQKQRNEQAYDTTKNTVISGTGPSSCQSFQVGLHSNYINTWS